MLFVLLFAATLSLQAQLINGVADRGVYTDSISFNVPVLAGYTYEVTLNGAPVAAGVSHVVNRMDYYDLAARRRQTSDGSVVSQLVRFIVVSSNRINGTAKPELGLIQWVPYPLIPSASSEFAGGQLSVVAPKDYPAGLEIPVVAWVDDGPGNSRRVNGNVTASAFAGSPLPLRRGVGHAFLPSATTPGALTYDAHIQSLGTNKLINIDSITTWSNVSGILPAGATWPANSRIRVTGHITIAAGNTLTIGAGTIVQLNATVNITNSGRTVINGTTEQPVVFTAATRVAPEKQAGAWGGFLLRGASAELIANGAIMTGAGAQSSFSFSPGPSHRSEQALLLVQSSARAFLTNCFLINNAGQIGNGYNSDVTYDHCLLQRAVTGGEYEGGTIIVNNSAVIEFPSIDGVYNGQIADADYDGIYFTTGTHILQNSLLGFAKDDAIDSGSGGDGTVVVSNCWVEAALHEGLAWSGGSSSTSGRKTWSYDSILINNGQGIECGWSTGPLSPLCVGGRLLSTANSVGARYGDNYEGTTGLGLKDGFLTVTNSLILHNYRDVWGQVWDNTWNYRVNDMDIQDNWLTKANTNHPNNTVWDPTAHASLLAPFMRTPVAADVGLGFANWDGLTLSSLSNGIPLRLSTFTTHPVSANWAVQTATATLATGTLTFQPGETVKHIFAPATGLSTQDLVRVVLSNPVGCELTAGAQAIIAPAEAAAGASVMLLPMGSRWQYLDDGSNQGIAWRAAAFDDTGWSNGLAQLGYGDSPRDEATFVRRTNPGGTITITFYFRKAIQVSDPANIVSLGMRLLRDDAGVVYVNGSEVFRSPNLPQPPNVIGYLTTATSTGENTIDSATVTSTNLVAGNSVIAVEIHQESTSSSDVSFDLELTGILAPRLHVARFDDDLVLYWGNTAYNLEASDQLGPDANWSTMTGARSPVTIAPGAPQKFFRLKK